MNLSALPDPVAETLKASLAGTALAGTAPGETGAALATGLPVLFRRHDPGPWRGAGGADSIREAGTRARITALKDTNLGGASALRNTAIQAPAEGRGTLRMGLFIGRNLAGTSHPDYRRLKDAGKAWERNPDGIAIHPPHKDGRIPGNPGIHPS